MTNYKLLVAYDGSKYNGFQKQSKHPEKTIQGKLENVLSQCFEEDIQIIASGRTDAGVHAKGQVCNFHASRFVDHDTLMGYLSTYLPQDLAILDISMVSPRFHARYNVVRKRYVYTIDNALFANPFHVKYAYHLQSPLNLALMEEAIKYLIGSHDFKAFTTLKSKTKSTVRHLYDITLTQEGSFITLSYEGNGFLQHMVRILSGTLIEIGLGKRAPRSILTLLENGTRSEAGFTAPAHGLCLAEVTY